MMNTPTAVSYLKKSFCLLTLVNYFRVKSVNLVDVLRQVQISPDEFAQYTELIAMLFTEVIPTEIVTTIMQQMPAKIQRVIIEERRRQDDITRKQRNIAANGIQLPPILF